MFDFPLGKDNEKEKRYLNTSFLFGGYSLNLKTSIKLKIVILKEKRPFYKVFKKYYNISLSSSTSTKNSLPETLFLSL